MDQEALDYIGKSQGAPVRLDTALREALARLATPAQEARARITTVPLPRVRGSAAMLSLLLQNLVANAVKYRAPEVEPVIAITCVDAADQHVISVQDNGIGIDPRFHESIFEPFRRLHAHEAYAGSGVGLATVARIVQRHGGEIRLTSVPGEGSCFS
ncbi:MAG: chemotaxis family two-component system sensor kinase Cph1, partial [Myxococcota bacterium]